MSETSRFRRKPVVIEATQWFSNGDHPADDCRTVTPVPGDGEPYLSEGKVVRYYRSPKLDGQHTCRHCGQIMRNHGWIDTLAGGHIACPGDWIITGVNGEIYPTAEELHVSVAESKALAEAIEHYRTVGLSPVAANLQTLFDKLSRFRSAPAVSPDSATEIGDSLAQRSGATSQERIADANLTSPSHGFDCPRHPRFAAVLRRGLDCQCPAPAVSTAVPPSRTMTWDALLRADADEPDAVPSEEDTARLDWLERTLMDGTTDTFGGFDTDTKCWFVGQPERRVESLRAAIDAARTATAPAARAPGEGR